jgi:small-conductance mechanosensitive channel
VQAVQRARRARWETLILLPLLVGVVYAYDHRRQLFRLDLPVRIASAIFLVVLGWALARALGRAMGPALFKRLDAGTAGTAGFLIRLVALTVAVLFALRLAGFEPGTLAVGGAFTAVIIGLAAQQTIGNLIAGLVLLSARPFRVGERVRFQAGALAGQIEGVVSSLGLLYTTLAQGEDRTMVPNSVVLGAAVVPLREPAAVDLRARLRPDVEPGELQKLLEDSVSVPTRAPPHIGLEEADAEEVVVRIFATPESATDGTELADEILAVVSRLTAAGPANGASEADAEEADGPSEGRGSQQGGRRAAGDGGGRQRSGSRLAPSSYHPKRPGQRG